MFVITLGCDSEIRIIFLLRNIFASREDKRLLIEVGSSFILHLTKLEDKVLIFLKMISL